MTFLLSNSVCGAGSFGEMSTRYKSNLIVIDSLLVLRPIASYGSQISNQKAEFA
jgi:hypothetical protein